MILAVDTSLGTAVALVGDGAAVEASTPHALGHAEAIGTLISEVLRRVPDAAIGHVATGMGPGPFTGLRIGIAAARAFALGRAVPVVPVPSHFAAALDVGEGRFAIVTDARRREVAVSVFEGVDADGIPNLLTPTVLVPRADLEGHLAGRRAIEVTEISAAALGRVAERALAAGRELAGPTPLYLRAPDATLSQGAR